jgi:hypothetical protein
MDWLKHLREYYNVTQEQAIELGTRSSGRKPSLPGSRTCEPVSDMTFEDIWDISERESLEGVFKFYTDQGAWSAFRQCVRHLDFINLHVELFKNFLKDGSHICEYGCGVAPFAFTLLNVISSDATFDVSLSDIENCEHLNFGHWRLQQLKQEREMKNLNICLKPVTVSTLPEYDKKLDFVIAFEVLEHVPSPTAVLNNILEQMNSKAIFVENFIKHEIKHNEPGPDLESAIAEREEFYNIVNTNFNLVGGSPESVSPNATRVWMRKK